MDNNMKFSLAIETLNQKIAETTIRLSKDLDNRSLKLELNKLLEDKNTLYTSTNHEELNKLIKKYGSNDNE